MMVASLSELGWDGMGWDGMERSLILNLDNDKNKSEDKSKDTEKERERERLNCKKNFLTIIFDR